MSNHDELYEVFGKWGHLSQDTYDIGGIVFPCTARCAIEDWILMRRGTNHDFTYGVVIFE